MGVKQFLLPAVSAVLKMWYHYFSVAQLQSYNTCRKDGSESVYLDLSTTCTGGVHLLRLVYNLYQKDVGVR